ncbi:hypothetical protein [Nonomuraea sp. NPDC002799]
MSSQTIRSIIAVATLMAGVSWLAPASMAGTCVKPERALLSATSVASSCDEHTSLSLNDGGSGSSRMATRESTRLAMAAGHMARRMGLTGLARAKSALGVTDLGGMAANWGMPSLISASPALFPAVPGPIGMKDLSTTAGVPALPALPALPKVPVAKQLPAGLSIGHAPFHNRVAGTGIQMPMDLQEPVRKVGADVIGVLLPKAVESVEGASMLPGGQAAAGFTGLVHGLGLK